MARVEAREDRGSDEEEAVVTEISKGGIALGGMTGRQDDLDAEREGSMKQMDPSFSVEQLNDNIQGGRLRRVRTANMASPVAHRLMDCLLLK